MLDRFFTGGKGAEIPALARLGVLFPRVEAVLPRWQLSDHGVLLTFNNINFSNSC